MTATTEETSIYALIGTTTPDPQGGSGGLEVMRTFDSKEEAENNWKGIADRAIRKSPNAWLTHGFHLVEVPPEKRETFERMYDTDQRAKRDPESVFPDEDGTVYFPRVQNRLRAFRGRWRQHLQSLIDNHKLE